MKQKDIEKAANNKERQFYQAFVVDAIQLQGYLLKHYLSLSSFSTIVIEDITVANFGKLPLLYTIFQYQHQRHAFSEPLLQQPQLIFAQVDIDKFNKLGETKRSKISYYLGNAQLITFNDDLIFKVQERLLDEAKRLYETDARYNSEETF